MNYYQEIRLLPNAEANLGFLWQKVFQQIHIALVENKIAENESAIGLSIPAYFVPEYGKKGFPLGDKIRLFAKTEAELKALNISQWLLRLEDYAQVKSIKPVPEGSQHACFVRKQLKGKNRILEKTLQMAKFKANETGEPIEKWFEEFSKTAPKVKDSLPFINTKSISGGAEGSRFPLFIEMELKEKPLEGRFNCYGFSRKEPNKLATVPWF